MSSTLWHVSSRRFLFQLTIFAIGAMTTVCCRAATVVKAPEFTAMPGESGMFEIVFQQDAIDVPNLAAYQVVVNLSGPDTNVELTSAGQATDPLISDFFQANALGNDGTRQRSAFASLNSGATPIVDGKGLMKLSFSIDAGATPGNVYLLTIPMGATSTLLSDASAMSVAFTPMDGSINIVPEPFGLLGALFGFTVVGFVRRKRRR